VRSEYKCEKKVPTPIIIHNYPSLQFTKFSRLGSALTLNVFQTKLYQFWHSQSCTFNYIENQTTTCNWNYTDKDEA